MFFQPATELIKINELLGGKTLAHCVAGISRSVTICIAYLMQFKNANKNNKNISPEEALKYIKVRRPISKPNKAFMAQLRQFEKRLDNPSYEYQRDRSIWDEEKFELEGSINTIEKTTKLLKLQLSADLK